MSTAANVALVILWNLGFLTLSLGILTLIVFIFIGIIKSFELGFSIEADKPLQKTFSGFDLGVMKMNFYLFILSIVLNLILLATAPKSPSTRYLNTILARLATGDILSILIILGFTTLAVFTIMGQFKMYEAISSIEADKPLQRTFSGFDVGLMRMHCILYILGIVFGPAIKFMLPKNLMEVQPNNTNKQKNINKTNITYF